MKYLSKLLLYWAAQYCIKAVRKKYGLLPGVNKDLELMTAILEKLHIDL